MSGYKSPASRGTVSEQCNVQLKMSTSFHVERSVVEADNGFVVACSRVPRRAGEYLAPMVANDLKSHCGALFFPLKGISKQKENYIKVYRLSEQSHAVGSI